MLTSLKKERYQSRNRSLITSNRLCGIFGNCSRSPPSSGTEDNRKEQLEEAQKSIQNGKTQKPARKVLGQCVPTPDSSLLFGKSDSIQKMHRLWLSDLLLEESKGLVSILRQSGCLRRTHVSHTQLQATPPPWLPLHLQRLPRPSSLRSPVADSPRTGPKIESFKYKHPSPTHP